MVPVIDISRWQGATNFWVMASHNVRGVIIRAGNGLTVDDTFDGYVRDAKSAGLATGSYWFCNPKAGTGTTQGHLLAAAHNRAGCELPPMLDVESYAKESGPGPLIPAANFAAWLRSMATQVQAESRQPIIYANAAFWNPNVADATFGDYDLLCARYPFYNPAVCAAHVPPLDAGQWADWIMAATTSRPQLPRGWSTWAGWQFSAGFNGRGRIYGTSSNDLDLNIVTDEAWARWTGATPATPPTTAPPVITPTIEEPEETDMRLIFTTDNQGIWMIHNGAIVQLSGPAYNALAKAGVPANTDPASWVNAAELDELKTLFPGTQAAAAVAPGGPHNVSGTFTGSTDG